MNKKSDEIRKNAQRMNTLAEIYDRVLQIRNNSYGQLDEVNEESETWKAWEGLEVEFETVNEVLEMILKLAK